MDQVLGSAPDVASADGLTLVSCANLLAILEL